VAAQLFTLAPVLCPKNGLDGLVHVTNLARAATCRRLDAENFLGTIVDKEDAFKCVYLRNAVSVTKNLNTHNRLYLQAGDAHSMHNNKALVPWLQIPLSPPV
jgi:hypothetical protein